MPAWNFKVFMDLKMNRTPLASMLLVALVTCGAGTAEPSRGAETQSGFSWQQPQAKVLANGDLEWAPHQFEYAPTQVVRYIDFEGGTDSNDGRSKQSAWKHHPWDPNAEETAQAFKGPCTYV